MLTTKQANAVGHMVTIAGRELGDLAADLVAAQSCPPASATYLRDRLDDYRLACTLARMTPNPGTVVAIADALAFASEDAA